MFNLPDELSHFLQHDAAMRAVVGREGKLREFKRGFIANDFSEYTKVLAAFAECSSCARKDRGGPPLAWSPWP